MIRLLSLEKEFKNFSCDFGKFLNDTCHKLVFSRKANLNFFDIYEHDEKEFVGLEFYETQKLQLYLFIVKNVLVFLKNDELA